MKKSNLTPEQQTLFNANFNRRAYDKAKEPIQKAMSESKTFDEFWERIKIMTAMWNLMMTSLL